MVIYENKFTSTFDDVDLIVKEIIQALRSFDELNNDTLLFRISFMLRELMNNGVEHGNKFDPNKHIYCVVKYHEDELDFRISDEGDGIEIPLKADVIDHLSERSRGIQTIKKFGFTLDVEGTAINARYKIEKDTGGD